MPKPLIQRYDLLSKADQKKRGLKLYGTMFNWRGDKVFTYRDLNYGKGKK